MSPTDPFDLGIDPELRYDTEHWRPSADYPEVTAHCLRRSGDRLEVRSTPAYGAPYTRGARIVAVWRNVQRAELVFDGTDHAVHFDLAARRLLDTPGELRLVVPLARDPLDPALWLALMEALAAEAPTLSDELAPASFSRDALTAVAERARAEGKVAQARWPEGYLFQYDPSPPRTTLCLYATPSVLPRLGVMLWADPSAPPSALVQGYFTPGVAALDAAVGRLRAVLAS